MNDQEQSELSTLYRKIPQQRSPTQLDESILGAAESLAPRRRQRRMPGWMTVLATACVATLAIVIVEPLQENGYAPAPSAPVEQALEIEETGMVLEDRDDRAPMEESGLPPATLAEDASTAGQNRFNGVRAQAPPSRNQPDPVSRLRAAQPLKRDTAEARRKRQETQSRYLESELPADIPGAPEAERARPATGLSVSLPKSANAPSGAIRPTPCTPGWFAHVAEVSGTVNGESGSMAPGSAAWRRRVEESLQLDSERFAESADLAAWCQWVDENLQ